MKIKSWLNATRLERIETTYLHALRVAGLLIATLCLVAALGFGVNAAWRIFVSTDVQPEPTSIDVATIAAQVAAERKEGDGSSASTDPVNITHTAFEKGVWAKYYAIYENAHKQNLNASDTLITSEDLMATLGYDLDTYRQVLEASSDPEIETHDYAQRVLRMVNNVEFQAMALKHVTEVMASAPVKARLTQYKAASKSEQRCVTTPRSQRVYQTCGYYYVYDCSYTRTVQDRRCEAVFPDTVLTPIAAFEQADRLFAEEWLGDEREKANTAADERSKRHEIRAMIGPYFQMALMIIGGFFTVMFFFLLVAIERHLRPKKNKPTDPVA